MSTARFKANRKATGDRINRITARIETGRDDVDDNAMEVDGDGMNLKGQVGAGATVRTLIPSSRFSSFILLHPDNPVDAP